MSQEAPNEIYWFLLIFTVGTQMKRTEKTSQMCHDQNDQKNRGGVFASLIIKSSQNSSHRVTNCDNLL